MLIVKSFVTGIVLIFLFAPAIQAQKDADAQSVLAPLLPRLRAIIRADAPRVDFAVGKEILIGQYRTGNQSVRLRDAAGRALPAFQQLGPRPGGFYLQIAVAPLSTDIQDPTGIQTHVTPPVLTRPWTTVTSTYPLKSGQKAIFMTWEAAPYAPTRLAAHVSQALADYVSTH